MLPTQGRVTEALPWVQEMLDLAKAKGQADLQITGHTTACECHFWGSELAKAVEHAANVLSLYRGETHRHLADILNQDPRTSARIFASICMWILGYPDQALRLGGEKDAHARRRGHPFDLGWALSTGLDLFDHRFGHADLHKRAEECERLGRDSSLPVLSEIMAPSMYGQALVREGRFSEGIIQLRYVARRRPLSGGCGSFRSHPVSPLTRMSYARSIE
jgi:hypothetical protein